jgi:tetratricopeptide (TPR) repeat protein
MPPSQLAREWYDLGNAWLDKGDWKRAGEAYTRALNLDPKLAGASLNLARALTEAADYDGALRALDTLAKGDPGNVRIITARAYALYKKGDADAALAAYREALAQDPYAPDAVYNAAFLELAAGDAGAAIADLERLSTANPDDGQAFLLLGRAIDRRAQSVARVSRAGAHDAGAKDGADGTNADDKDAAAAADKSAASALAAYEKAKSLGKADTDALERMAFLYSAERRYTEAMDAFEAVFKADPKRASAAFSLARLRFVIADDAEKGLAALKSALDAGFSDKAAASALLAEPDLPEREKVFELLKSKDLAE